MVLSLSPVLLSHSAWQIQCRFERSRLAAAARDGCPRDQKATLGSGSSLMATSREKNCRRYHTNSGQGTMVDLTVFIAIASLIAREMPSSSKG
jgi:hypothetical protein